MRRLTVLLDWFGEAFAGLLIAAYVAAAVAGLLVIPVYALLTGR